jgi:hypothetical protein
MTVASATMVVIIMMVIMVPETTNWLNELDVAIALREVLNVVVLLWIKAMSVVVLFC